MCYETSVFSYIHCRHKNVSYISVSVCVCVWGVCAGMFMCSQEPLVAGGIAAHLVPEVQELVSCFTWVGGIECRSSARAARALSY